MSAVHVTPGDGIGMGFLLVLPGLGLDDVESTHLLGASVHVSIRLFSSCFKCAVQSVSSSPLQCSAVRLALDDNLIKEDNNLGQRLKGGEHPEGWNLDLPAQSHHQMVNWYQKASGD